MITEWIPYNNLQKIEYLTKGGFAKIYRATWINGGYYEWDSENQQLQRFVNQVVILKELENIENASQNWFEEAKSHLTISNKYTLIVQCYGLTQNPSNEQQEAFHSKLYDFNIPTNIDDFGRSSNKNNKRNSIVIEAGSTRLTGVFKKLRVNSKSVNIQNKYYENTIRQPQTCDIDDDDDYNNPNLHSEEQEELEIPNDGF
ncbi:unnamed protein product [Rhizophagus irregularis]|uniref:Protein kinase domain-containing protein n=1 Tax=Rhizophagus irregularis TaxID=588596 RepID=A0A916E186_9GLOM|nr:unnamed protein product [Rhizophagus irregularis]CAB5343905.1 unnamed protein product [Rhizophagus irregularis]CAB5380076.1 unnamed protein product [Rhizophagus irregularis]